MKHKVIRKQQISKMCFICGVKNNFGLHARFYETNRNEVVALITPSEQHQGYPGRMHGGIASAILDETIMRSVSHGKDDQLWGVTLELKTTFRKPVPVGQELKVLGRVTFEGNRSFEGTGEIILPDGEVAVSATGKYLKVKIDNMAEELNPEEDWILEDSSDDPVEIEIP
jgi:acyl-coenzyme A thioesterase PaaI-like protein